MGPRRWAFFSSLLSHSRRSPMPEKSIRTVPRRGQPGGHLPHDGRDGDAGLRQRRHPVRVQLLDHLGGGGLPVPDDLDRLPGGRPRLARGPPRGRRDVAGPPAHRAGPQAADGGRGSGVDIPGRGDGPRLPVRRLRLEPGDPRPEHLPRHPVPGDPHWRPALRRCTSCSCSATTWGSGTLPGKSWKTSRARRPRPWGSRSSSPSSWAC